MPYLGSENLSLLAWTVPLLVGGGVGSGWGLLEAVEGWEARSWEMMEGGPEVPSIGLLAGEIVRVLRELMIVVCWSTVRLGAWVSRLAE